MNNEKEKNSMHACLKTIAAYALVVVVLGGFVALCAVSDFNNYAKLQTKTQKVVTV